MTRNSSFHYLFPLKRKKSQAVEKPTLCCLTTFVFHKNETECWVVLARRGPFTLCTTDTTMLTYINFQSVHSSNASHTVQQLAQIFPLSPLKLLPQTLCV